MVRGDSARLQQVVCNLLSNAIKFTAPGGRIEVELAMSGDQVQISVTDTGQGIKPEFLPHVFERFRQEDGSISRRHGGLGLGLAIVRHLVELHSGTVEAQSEGEGCGSRFIVRLPCERESPAALERPTESHSIPRPRERPWAARSCAFGQGISTVEPVVRRPSRSR